MQHAARSTQAAAHYTRYAATLHPLQAAARNTQPATRSPQHARRNPLPRTARIRAMMLVPSSVPGGKLFARACCVYDTYTHTPSAHTKSKGMPSWSMHTRGALRGRAIARAHTHTAHLLTPTHTHTHPHPPPHTHPPTPYPPRSPTARSGHAAYPSALQCGTVGTVLWAWPLLSAPPAVLKAAASTRPHATR